jgi:hypothetical protein
MQNCIEKDAIQKLKVPSSDRSIQDVASSKPLYSLSPWIGAEHVNQKHLFSKASLSVNM